MKSYRLLLFDFDGTLVDTMSDIAYYANSVLKDHGHPPCPLEVVKRSIGQGVHELLKGVAAPFAEDPVRLEEAVALFKQRYRREPVRQTRPFAGVVEMLAGPLSGVPKAIITNKPQDITIEILEHLKMRSYFEVIIGMHAGFPAKPDPTSTFQTIQKFNAKKDETVYIGDSRVDAETSRNAGIDFAWMDYGYDNVETGERTYRFSDAKDWGRLVSSEVQNGPRIH